MVGTPSGMAMDMCVHIALLLCVLWPLLYRGQRLYFFISLFRTSEHVLALEAEATLPLPQKCVSLRAFLVVCCECSPSSQGVSVSAKAKARDYGLQVTGWL